MERGDPGLPEILTHTARKSRPGEKGLSRLCPRDDPWNKLTELFPPPVLVWGIEMERSRARGAVRAPWGEGPSAGCQLPRRTEHRPVEGKCHPRPPHTSEAEVTPGIVATLLVARNSLEG